MPHADNIDQDLARSALAKQRSGGRPTARELSALRRIEKAREEADRWRYYAAIPKRHWQQLSGRQPKILNEQATRYGIPVGGPTVDLAAVARWLHDFLATNARRLAEADLLDGQDSPALERYRLARAKLAEFQLSQNLGDHLPRSQVHEALGMFAQIIRAAGDTIQRQCGTEPFEILDEALKDAIRAFETHFTATDDGDPQPDTIDDADAATNRV